MIPGAFQNGFQNQRVFKVDSIPCKPPEGHLHIVAQVNDNNPVFQTVRSGIEEFRADVPAGEYSVYLYFCELSTVEPSEGLVYNFGNDQARPYSESVFDVEVNGRTVIKDCDICSEAGSFRPVVRKISVSVAEGEGLSVRFSASKGKPFLNAIRIWREF